MMSLQLLHRRLTSLRPSQILPPFKTTPLLTNAYSTRPLPFTSCKPHPFFTSARPRTMGNQPSTQSQPHLLSYRLFSAQHSQGSKTIMPACWLLFSINTLVFGAISYSTYSNDRALQVKLQTNTGVSAASWDQGRWWTTLTSSFTHHNFFHYAFNMMTMVSICKIIAYAPSSFTGVHIIGLALGAGIFSSGAYVWTQKEKVEASKGKSSGILKYYSKDKEEMVRHYYTPAVGASGSIMGLMGFAACLMPRFPMSLMFIPIPIPLWVTVGLYAVADTYMLNSKNTFIAHAGHLGGLAFGVLYYAANFRRAHVGILKGVSGMLRRK